MGIDEIVRSYKNAENPERQIKILSELTLRSMPEIRKILIDKGVYKDLTLSWNDEKDTKLVKMREEGKPYKEIAEELGHTPAAVQTRFHKLKRLAKAEPQENTTETKSVLETPNSFKLLDDIHTKNARLSAVVGILRITHDDAVGESRSDYWKTADKYDVIIPLLEKLVEEYEALS